MGTSFDDMNTVDDPGDDGQLTIKIPNPKVYKARQSLWIGRRGKPRCDHCRLNNLKCDRVLPACNHCSWASGRVCKYTPLPTPAHRGIPRCDLCRSRNLKCDRNLPVCNFCTLDKESECNYTPKKRSRLASDLVAPSRQDTAAGLPTHSHYALHEKPSKVDRHTFYGQNVASSSSHKNERSPSQSDAEALSDPDIPLYLQTSHLIADGIKSTKAGTVPLQPIAPRSTQETLQTISFTPPFSSQGVLVKTSTVVPWTSRFFVPLPDSITHRLSLINSVEVPDRQIFNDSLDEFLGGIMNELKETACLSPEVYSMICNALETGDSSRLSDRIRAWASFHHVCSGSHHKRLLLIPRDTIFAINSTEVQRLRQMYLTHIDEQISETAAQTAPSHDCREEATDAQWIENFERVPVQPQIYDILTYTHRSHDSPLVMMLETKRLGFASITWPMSEIYVRLCPLCNLRGKQEVSHLGLDMKSKAQEAELRK
ncbi:hypothetical protein AMATHDRAFT_57591 [Amanita thiersii Skay4041]|uniref:Zn(2)-C6 fungal-type domain-containing protein n=1 Tax=Amanita thiersii Skay4041 TaxID=703135 RepID=A0A2A9NW52_9AGAR|nr:hypothetical protein AMATHDRAFT_57591 [Amanita thiersii Skay4041]